jgi:hypothetical protein
VLRGNVCIEGEDMNKSVSVSKIGCRVLSISADSSIDEGSVVVPSAVLMVEFNFNGCTDLVFNTAPVLFFLYTYIYKHTYT